MPAEPAATLRTRTRWRRWLWRLLQAAGVLVLIFVLFHRPILRFAVNHGTRYWAGSGGMELSWLVDGGILNGIDLRDIEITGNAGAPVRHLKAGRISADYNVWRAVSDGPGQFVDEVVLENVDLDLDPSRFPKPDPDKPKSEPSAPPKVRLPNVRMKNVNARIRLPDGDLVIRGLNFTLLQNSAGVLEFSELQLPGRLPVLRQVKGTTETSPASFTLKSLALQPDLLVRFLTVDLNRLPERRLDIAAALTVPGGVVTDKLTAGANPAKVIEGTGEVEISGHLEGLGKEPAVDGQFKMRALNETTLAPWVTLPPDLAWTVESMDAAVSGPVKAPQLLRAAFQLSGSGIRAGTLRLDKARMEGTLEQGLLTVKTTDVSTGLNRLVATAGTHLPSAWQDMSKIIFKVEGDVDFPQVAEFFAGQPPLTGKVTGKFAATLDGGKLSAANASLTGAALATQGVPVDRVELEASGDARQIRVAKLRASLDADNFIDATAELGLTGEQQLRAEWTAALPNLEKFSTFSGRRELPGPDGGRLKGSGKITANLADWQRQDFSRTVSDVHLEASAVKWKSGGLESLSVHAGLAGGRIQLQQFTAVINERNALNASGGGSIVSPWEFSAKIDGDMKQLADLNGLMDAFGVQKFVSGKAQIQWEGSGRGGDFSITGGGTVKVDGLKLDGMTEAASLSLRTAHSGRRADIPVLEASLGTLKIQAPCVVTETGLEIPRLTVTAPNLPPVEGRVLVPLDFAQTGGLAGPVSLKKNLDIDLTVKKLDIAKTALAAGRKIDAQGTVDAEVKISGQVLNPTAVLVLNMSGISTSAVKQKLSPAGGTISLSLRDRKLESLVNLTQKPLQPLKAEGSIPFDVEKILRDPSSLNATPLNFTLNLPDSDLSGLRPFVEAIESMKGTLGLNAKVAGTLMKPVITGEFHASAPAVAFKKADLPDARDVKVRLRFEGTRVVIDEASAMLAGGTVGARGNVDWSDFGNPKIDAVLTAREALVLRDDSVTMRANADITARGSLQQSNVAGRVELVRGRVFKEIEFLPLSLPNQLPPAPPAVTVGNKKPPSLPPPFSNWTFNVDIVTHDPVRLLGNVLNGGVVSDLHLRGNGAGPVLEGKISLRDARVRLPFSRMTISRGDVIFTADKPFNPTIDVQGDSFVNSYQVTINAYGSALDPKIRFSSSPPLPEGEIATLLATGSTSGDLRASQGEAANRAAFLVVSQMYRKLFRKAAHAKEDDSPPRLSFSFSLLNNSGGARSFSAIYEINRNLQAVGAMSQTGSFRGLLYYLIRFR